MDKIQFFDAESNQVIMIPATELASGAVLTSIDGVEGQIWTQPTDGEAADFKHPPFNASIRIYIEQIQAAFAEHYPLSREEWENGFRRDENAAQQIAVWWYAADIYRVFAANELSRPRRADIYKCLLACMSAGPTTIWDIYQPESISRAEARQIVERYFIITPLDLRIK
jgi:hypothetical protein